MYPRYCLLQGCQLVLLHEPACWLPLQCRNGYQPDDNAKKKNNLWQQILTYGHGSSYVDMELPTTSLVCDVYPIRTKSMRLYSQYQELVKSYVSKLHNLIMLLIYFSNMLPKIIYFFKPFPQQLKFLVLATSGEQEYQ